jgi:hypothetical protein
MEFQGRPLLGTDTLISREIIMLRIRTLSLGMGEDMEDHPLQDRAEEDLVEAMARYRLKTLTVKVADMVRLRLKATKQTMDLLVLQLGDTVPDHFLLSQPDRILLTPRAR